MAMRTYCLPRSSWLRAFRYRPTGDRRGTLTLWLRRGGRLVVEGAPCWLPGVLRRAKSPGGMYHRHVVGAGLKVESIAAPEPPGPTSAELVSLLEQSIAEAMQRRG